VAQSSIVLLALLPLAEWAITSIARRAIQRETSNSAKEVPPLSQDAEKRIRGILNRAYLATHATVLFGTSAWLWRSGLGQELFAQASSHITRDIALGASCGLAWYSVLFHLAALQAKLIPEVRFVWEVPALYATGSMRWSLMVLGAAAIELWRITALSSLLHEGYLVSSALLVCTAVYAVRLFDRGMPRMAYAALEGLIYAGLFLWLGSLIAPLAARAIFELGMSALFRQAVPLFQTAGLPAVACCPLCRQGLTWREVRYREAFRCPKCDSVIGVSNSWLPRTKAMGVASYVCFLVLFFGWAPGFLQASLRIFFGATVVCGFAARGCLQLLNALFPPAIEPGSPGIPELDFSHKPPQGEHDEEEEQSKGA